MLLRNITNKQARRRLGWNFNITPLVDIVFQLIVFFMVVSQVVSARNQTLQVPRPDRSQAREQSPDKYTVINLFAGPAGTIDTIKVNAMVLPDLPALADLLLQHSRRFDGRMKLLVRADRQIRYAHVRGVLEVISNAGIGSVELAAQCQQADDDETLR